MKKIGIFSMALVLMAALCACNRSKMDTQNTTGNTMPTVITTIPTTEERIPGTSFQPDDDGIIGETSETTNPTQTPRYRGRMRLR